MSTARTRRCSRSSGTSAATTRADGRAERRPPGHGSYHAAAVAWPVAHIADIAWLAVAVNVALVAGFGALVPIAGPDREPAPDREGAVVN